MRESFNIQDILIQIWVELKIRFNFDGIHCEPCRLLYLKFALFRYMIILYLLKVRLRMKL